MLTRTVYIIDNYASGNTASKIGHRRYKYKTRQNLHHSTPARRPAARSSAVQPEEALGLPPPPRTPPPRRP